MNKLLGLFLLALAFLTPGAANAANCFWVGGTATWDNTNTGGGGAGGIKWASASGGGTACAGSGTGGSPGSGGDSATFDAASGGGTVTVATTINGSNTIGNMTAGAFTGTIDFDANDPDINLQGTMNLSGTGTRKFLLGAGTFTFTGTGSLFDLATVTNLDGTSVFTANFVASATTTAARSFSGGGRTFGSFTLSANTSKGAFSFAGANTFSSVSLAAGSYVNFTGGATTTIINPVTWVGTSTDPIYIGTSNVNSGLATISIASGSSTCTWCALFWAPGTGGSTFTATNSLDLGRNTGWTITVPSGGGGGGRIIGG